MENSGKTAVFPGGYGRIGEIQHGRIIMAGFRSIGLKYCPRGSRERGAMFNNLFISVF